MKGVRFTKAERDLLERVLSVKHVDLTCWGSKAPKVADSILQKLRAAVDAPKGVDIVPVEEALVRAARGKVVPLEDGHAVASRRAQQMKVTPELAEMVGAWMALQGPQTILDVLNKWFQWLPKARSTVPPQTLPPGLGPAGRSHEQGVPQGLGKAKPGLR
jgi:hypothetical protein